MELPLRTLKRYLDLRMEVFIRNELHEEWDFKLVVALTFSLGILVILFIESQEQMKLLSTRLDSFERSNAIALTHPTFS